MKMMLRPMIAFLCLMLMSAGAAVRSESEAVIVIDSIESQEAAKDVESRALAGDQVAMLRLWRYHAMEFNNLTESQGWLWLAAKHGNRFAEREMVRMCQSRNDSACVSQWSSVPANN